MKERRIKRRIDEQIDRSKVDVALPIRVILLEYFLRETIAPVQREFLSVVSVVYRYRDSENKSSKEHCDLFKDSVKL